MDLIAQSRQGLAVVQQCSINRASSGHVKKVSHGQLFGVPYFANMCVIRTLTCEWVNESLSNTYGCYPLSV